MYSDTRRNWDGSGTHGSPLSPPCDHLYPRRNALAVVHGTEGQ